MSDELHPLPELVDVKRVAEMLSCSVRHVYRMSDAGRMPAPHKLGAARRWSTDELKAWVSDGCPSVEAK